MTRKALILILVSTACAGAAGTGAVLYQKAQRPAAHGGCVEQLVAAAPYVCARLESGSVHCWGNRRIPGLTGFAYTPKRVPGFEQKAISLFTEIGSACAGTRDGTLWCWGGNDGSELGHPAELEYSDRALKHVLRNVTSMAIFGQCAIAEGKLRCWDSPQDALDPMVVSGLPAAPKHVSGGRMFACVLLENGQVWCRGANLDGQQGIGKTEVATWAEAVIPKASFTRVETLGNDVKQLVSGTEFSCALKKDGSVWCWGKNDHGEAGNGHVQECRVTPDVQRVCEGSVYVPERVKGLPPIAEISAGNSTACALEASGTGWCWGAAGGWISANGKAKITTHSAVPLRIPLQAPLRSIAPGLYYTCAIQRDGAVKCWGEIGEVHKDWNDPADVPFDCAAR